MSRSRSLPRPVFGFALVAVAGVALAGCGNNGIQVEGKLLDTLGVSSSALSGAKTEPTMQERAPLVVPPSTELRDPETLVATTPASANPLWPKDAEQTAAADKAAREAAVRKACDDEDWLLRTNPDEFNRITENGSLCSTLGSVFDGLL